MHTPWKAEDIALLEKWCGIPGPAAPWLLTALAADLVSLRKQPPAGVIFQRTGTFHQYHHPRE